MKRRTEHQKLVEEADAWVKAIVNNRQNGICLRTAYPSRVSCGGPLQGAHILRKGGLYRSIRHDPDNVVVMCRNHHMFWAHLYEHDFTEWIEEIYPGRIGVLKKRSLWKAPNIKENICVLKAIYAQEQRDPPAVKLPRSQDLGKVEAF